MNSAIRKEQAANNEVKSALEQFQNDISSALGRYYREIHSEAIKRGIAAAKQARKEKL